LELSELVMELDGRLLRLAFSKCALSSKQRPQQQALKSARHEEEETDRK